jgi:hypothetical protein
LPQRGRADLCSVHFERSQLTVTSAIGVPATGTTPEYCQVIGTVATNGEGYGAGSALFRLKLPLVWNNHFLFEGCGSNCGSIT